MRVFHRRIFKMKGTSRQRKQLKMPHSPTPDAATTITCDENNWTELQLLRFSFRTDFKKILSRVYLFRLKIAPWMGFLDPHGVTVPDCHKYYMLSWLVRLAILCSWQRPDISNASLFPPRWVWWRMAGVKTLPSAEFTFEIWMTGLCVMCTLCGFLSSLNLTEFAVWNNGSYVFSLLVHFILM